MGKMDEEVMERLSQLNAVEKNEVLYHMIGLMEGQKEFRDNLKHCIEAQEKYKKNI